MTGPAPDSAALAAENALLRAEVQALRQELEALHPSGGAGSNGAAQQKGRTNGDDGETGPHREQQAGASSSAPAACPLRRTFECTHGMNKDQVQRYSRHLLLPAFGVEAQARLCAGSVLIIGCGGLGSPAALYLAAAGVGEFPSAFPSASCAGAVH